jgi:adhesin/invasin
MITRAFGRRFSFDVQFVLAAVLLVIGAVTFACDSAPLLAPTQSTIQLTTTTRVVPLGGSAELQATVLENSGSSVPNGTTVRFITNLGRIEPAEAQTRNGVATATFVAGTESGTAQVRAVSGLASGGGGTTTGTGTNQTTTAAANMVEIAVGAAAAGNITLSANPSTVRPSGSSVEIGALVNATNGSPLPNVPVSFSTTRGTINPIVANTDANGVARTTLTASETATVTARVGASGTGTGGGTGTPPPDPRTATLEVRASTVASFTLAVSPTQGAAGQPVTLTITPAANTAPRVTINWGDGTAPQDIGVVSAVRGVVHTYTAPGFFTIEATGTSPEGDTFTNAIPITVGSSPPVQIQVTPTSGQANTVFTLTITPTTGALIDRIVVDWADGTVEDLGAISSQTTRQHQYSGTGNFTIRVDQFETGGRRTTATVTVTVNP